MRLFFKSNAKLAQSYTNLTRFSYIISLITILSLIIGNVDSNIEMGPSIDEIDDNNFNTIPQMSYTNTSDNVVIHSRTPITSCPLAVWNATENAFVIQNYNFLTFSSITQSSIYIYQSTNYKIIIRNNIISSNGQRTAVEILNSSNIVIENNIISNPIAIGIDLIGCSDIEISGNKIFNSSNTAIRASPQSINNKIHDNEIFDCNDNGIWHEGTGGLIYNNKINGTLGPNSGIWLRGSNYDNSVFNNTVDDCSTAIRLRFDATDNPPVGGTNIYHNTITNNILFNNGEDISLDDSAVNNYVYNNYFIGPTHEKIHSPTHYLNRYNPDSEIIVQWNFENEILAYSYEWTSNPSDLPDTIPEGDSYLTQSAVNLTNGNWYFHLRPFYNATGWWPSAWHFGPVGIDTENPNIPTNVLSATHTVNVFNSNTTIFISWTAPSDGTGSGIIGYSYSWSSNSNDEPDQEIDTILTNITSLPVPTCDNLYFHLKAVDYAGRTSTTVHFGPIKIDNQAPTNPISCIQEMGNTVSDVWQNLVSDPYFSWSGASDVQGTGVNGYNVYWGESSTGTSENYQSGTTYDPPSLFQGCYYLRVSTIDNFGIHAPWKTLYIFKYDNVLPTNPTTCIETAGTLIPTQYFYDTYESNNVGVAPSGWSTYSSGNSISVVDSPIYEGTRSLKLIGNSGAYASTYATIGQTVNRTFDLEARVYFPTPGNASENGGGIKFLGIGVTFTYSTTAQVLGDSGSYTGISTNAWHLIKINYNWTTQATTIYVDGVNRFSFSKAPQYGTGFCQGNRIFLWSGDSSLNNSLRTIYFDNILLNVHENRSSTNDPNFTWSGANDLSNLKYYVYWGTDPAGTSSEFVTTNSYDAPETLQGITYLRVRTEDAVGYQTTGWTTIYYFNYYGAEPMNPKACVQTVGTTNSSIWQSVVNNPSFTWSGAAALSPKTVSGYYVYWGTSSSGESANYQTGTSFNPGAVAEGTYYLRIKVKDSNNVEAKQWRTLYIFRYDTTVPNSFTTPCIETSSLTKNDVWQFVVNEPYFIWSAPTDVSGISKYYIYWGTNPSGESYESTTIRAYNPSKVTSGVYYLRVKAQDLAGLNSSWITLYTFKYDFESPTNPTSCIQINGITENGVWQNIIDDPSFTWAGAIDSHSGIQGYNVYWGPLPNGESSYFTASSSFNPTSVTAGVYYLRIRTIDNTNNFAKWTTIYTFKVLHNLPTVQYTSGSTTTNYGTALNLTWTISDISVNPSLSERKYTIKRDGQIVEMNTWSVGNITYTIGPNISSGIHSFEIEVDDGDALLGNVTDVQNISVMNSLPSFVFSGNINVDFGTGTLLQWQITDTTVNPILVERTYQIFENGTKIHNSTWSSGGYGSYNVPITNRAGIYNYTILVSDGDVAIGYASNTQFVTINAVNPNPPTNQLAEMGNQKIVVSWTPIISPSIQDGGSSVHGYLIQRENYTVGNWNIVTYIIGNSISSWDDISVVLGTNYRYRIYTNNSAGLLSSAAITDSAIAYQTADAVLNFIAISGSLNQTIKNTWTEPDNSILKDQTFVRYELQRSLDGISWGFDVTISDKGTTFYNWTSLTNGQQYYFRIRIITDSGGVLNGDWAICGPATPYWYPSAPTDLLIVYGPNNLTISWTAGLNQGRPITSYKIYRSIDNINYENAAIIGEEFSYQDTDLTPGIEYYYYVTAINDKGESLASITIHDVPRRSPYAPLLNINTGDRQIDLNWVPNATYSGNSLTEWKIYESLRSTPGTGVWSSWISDSGMTVNHSQSSYTRMGLTNGYEYRYYIVGINSEGEGDFSNIVLGTPNLIIPAAPNLNNIVPNPSLTGYIEISWTPVSNVNQYHLYRSTSPISNISGLTAIANLTALTYHDNITINGTYYYVVTARNASGESSISNCVNISIILYPPIPNHPASPILDTIVPNPNNSGNLTLYWNIVDGATTYLIYRDTSIITSVENLNPINSVSINYYFDSGLINGTYYYVIVAVNSSGASNLSNCESVYISIPSTSITTTSSSSTPSSSTDSNTSSTTSVNGPKPFRLDGMPVFVMIMMIGIMIGILLYQKRNDIEKNMI
jgi:hypothetical protein